MILLKAVNSNDIFIITIIMMILALHAESLIAYWLEYLRNCCLENKICICIGGQIHKSSLDNCCLWVSWLFWEIECQPQGAALKCSYRWINRSIVFYSREERTRIQYFDYISFNDNAQMLNKVYNLLAGWGQIHPINPS